MPFLEIIAQEELLAGTNLGVKNLSVKTAVRVQKLPGLDLVKAVTLYVTW